MLIFNKWPGPSGLGQNIPANGARPEQCRANNISQTVWSMKNKCNLRKMLKVVALLWKSSVLAWVSLGE